MARSALHPKTNEKISIEDWELYYKEIKPRCMICGNDLYIRSGNTPSSAKHFIHFPHSNCPSIPNNRERYNKLKPIEKDYKNAKSVKKQFLSNMWTVYEKCRSLLDGELKLKDFKDMVSRATEKNIWLYKSLTLDYLPYVLLVNYGVFQKGRKRNKVYLVLDSQLSNYEDLWIESKIKQKIWKVYPDEFLIEEFDIDFNFTTSSLSPDYFLFYVTGLQGENEGDFLKW
ncbi:MULTISPECIES: hypothetical protein [Bacillus]|uniref:hypothetical protein n=1 Tax=Bacillus TaxID=1386 RepID=UPI000F77CF1E|nr:MULTISPECIES: hypothetical protein [Bacillus]MDJ0285335.1 hypothetical protein [Bacillus altitudinis]